MTKVFLHGKLGKEFGNEFNLSINKPQDVIKAIDANNEGFQKRIFDLSQEGAQYSLIADNQIIGSVEDFSAKRKIKEIHMVPVIYGSGVGALAIGIGVLAAVGGYVTEYVVLSTILYAVALAAISYGVQSLLAKPPAQNNQGSYGTAAATSQSYLFTNGENVTQQGNPVPLGYGRLKIGSAVIQQTIKNYPNSIATFNEFVNQSAQEGQASMSVISTQVQ